MQQYRKNLGKVSLTAEGVWDGSKSFDILSIVYDEHTQHAFISKQPVPEGVDLYNKEYWMPLNVSGYADNNVIILSKKTSEAAIQSYTLEEAIASIKSVGRRPGAILGFYNENADRLDIGGRWELWQFNDTNVYNWDNVDSWQNLYYNYNKFVGWYRDEITLKKYVSYPEVGCYAYVGDKLYETVVYVCNNKHIWEKTSQYVQDYVNINVTGNVTVGPNGNWYNDGKDTGIKAQGGRGITPKIRIYNNKFQVSYNEGATYLDITDIPVYSQFRTYDNKLQLSLDLGNSWINISEDLAYQFREQGNKLQMSKNLGKSWETISDYIAAWLRVNNNRLEISRDNIKWDVISDFIAARFRWEVTEEDVQSNNLGRLQISRNEGLTWDTLTGSIKNSLHISKYIGVDDTLPTTGISEGTIYAKGPYYEDNDTLQEYPKYRLWVYAWKNDTLAWQDNGEFSSVTAGIVQETGDSETEVMSQKAVTAEFNKIYRIFDGGRADSKFGGTRVIDCGGANPNA